MKRDILTYPDPLLAEKCPPVSEITEEIRELAKDMAETMYANEGLGLAAPQVGESCRLVVVDVSGPNEQSGLIHLVNPVIVSSEGKTTTDEGCLSVSGFRANVDRAEKVTVKAQDLDGNEITIDADGIKAVCLQHEIDHLDGVLFIDRISRLKRSIYDKKVRKWEKKKQLAQQD